jgi:hypothetical protein
MNAEDMRILSACFDLPENMAITAVHPTALTLTIDLACSDPTACCPLCHQFSECIANINARLQTFLAEDDGSSCFLLCGNTSATRAIAYARFSRNGFPNWSSRMHA